ncbi:MAG TPA: hypothetical protein VFH61_02420, partial [Thermoleophilia bacterium]|nr:hypothetical protein [Thermoleophilia bacterium]
MGIRSCVRVLLTVVLALAALLVGATAQSEAAGLPGPQTAHGSDHTLLIKPDGSLWSWGANAAGQLGTGSTGAQYPVAARVGTASDWAGVACGDSFSFGIKSDGSLYAWGLNGSGQLGLGDAVNRTAPQRVGSDNDWVAVAGGNQHALALKSDGSLWTWGANSFGQLGLGDTTDVSTPTRVGAATDWDVIACGAEFSAALTSGRTLWVWGRNDRSQLGLGDTAERLAPTQVGSAADWTRFDCGDEDMRALKSDGTLWAWGFNSYGQLGLGDTAIRSAPTRVGADADWAAIAAGDDHSVALKSGGSLWTWGDNNYGQLGQGTADNAAHPTPIRVGTATDWSRILCGDDFTTALRPGEALWGCGDNTTGDLSLGDLISRSTPTLLFILGDATPPGIASLTSSTHPDSTTWYADADPSFSWSASDASGIAGYKWVLDAFPGTAAAIGYPSTAMTKSYAGVTDGVQYFHVRAVDRAGNWGLTSTRQVKIDTTAPVTTQSGADDAWHTDPVTVTFTATDALSGVSLTEYRVDDGQWTTGSAVTVSAAGTHTVGYRSLDNAGNVEAEKTCQVLIGTGSLTITVTAPAGTTSQAQGSALPVTWTT